MKKFKNKVLVWSDHNSVLEAFEKELKFLGYTIHPIFTEGGRPIIPNAISTNWYDLNATYGWCYQSFPSPNQSSPSSKFQLPQQWDIALEAVKETVEELVRGKWYITKGTDVIFRYTKTVDESKIYGDNNHINNNNEKEAYIADTYNAIREATKEEIENHLIKIAKSKGYEGKTIKPMLKNVGEDGDYSLKLKKFIYFKDADSLYADGNILIYKDGKWAEILEEKEKYIKTNIDGANNTDHPKFKESAFIGHKLKVIKEDNASLPFSREYEKVYICEGGYVVYKSCVKEISKEEYEKKEEIKILGYKAEFLPNFVKFGCTQIPNKFIRELSNRLADVPIDDDKEIVFTKKQLKELIRNLK